MIKPANYALLLIILNTTACGVGSQYQRPAVHDLGPADKEQEHRASTWSVAQIDAPAWLWDEQIRYRLLYSNPTQVRFYTQDRWVAPPPSLLSQIMPKPDGRQNYRVSIQLLDFEQIFDQPGESRVILNFDVKAKYATSGKIVGQKRFQLQQSHVRADAQGAISALVSLSHDMVNKLDQWLQGLPDN